MDTSKPKPHTPERTDSRKLRTGFSTGTAMTAAAMAALRCLLTGRAPWVVAVRLPAGYFMPVSIASCSTSTDGQAVVARVIKDGGDDPDVTHKAELRARVRFVSSNVPGTGASSKDHREATCQALASGKTPGICLIGGEGVGVVTKPGLPVGIGEPAVNPVPRQMLSRNLAEELLRLCSKNSLDTGSRRYGESMESKPGAEGEPARPRVFIPMEHEGIPSHLLLEVLIEVEKGVELSRFTLNPRLGIVGGISILGTTGIVRPFSHKAYEETIQSALSVAASNGCDEVVLSTGGKSERYARKLLADRRPEAFVQVADFFGFAVEEACRAGFKKVVHSAFFGKVVKMAQGHRYTHAHEVALDLAPLAEIARETGYDGVLCRELAEANTARHALDLLLAHQATDVILTMARGALRESLRLAKGRMAVRLLLFDYDGTLLADLEE
jgi:cobalt-precorrin-5B (C1)-methyltransferase